MMPKEKIKMLINDLVVFYSGMHGAGISYVCQILLNLVEEKLWLMNGVILLI